MPESPIEAIPLSLYIHIPWCVRKCPYCDFNSHQLTAEDIPERDYLTALLQDLEQALPLIWGRRVVSIFLGGGTPSLMSPAFIAELLAGLRARLTWLPGTEITMEANPGTVEAHNFSDFHAAGITRISLGIQSFSDQNLTGLGRIHDSAQAHAAIEVLAGCDFDSFNLDLMFGLPQQTVTAAVDDLQQALAYSPPHLSLYQLTLEPNTPFMHQPPAGLPDDDALAAMQTVLSQMLADHGLQRYEVSAYATAPWQCRHNVNYWQFGDYLGIGAGAHSKISGSEGVERFSRPRQPTRYMSTAGTVDAFINRRNLTVDDLLVEFMLNALRLRQGFDTDMFERRTGLSISRVSERIEQGVQRGLLEWHGNTCSTTEKGFRFLNETQMIFT